MSFGRSVTLIPVSIFGASTSVDGLRFSKRSNKGPSGPAIDGQFHSSSDRKSGEEGREDMLLDREMFRMDEGG